LSTRNGDQRMQIQDTATISSEPSRKPSTGEMKMKATVLNTPESTSGPAPALASVAPRMPPISACELLEGMPYHQVIRFQTIAPMSAPKTTY
jgi:hypothetical protein